MTAIFPEKIRITPEDTKEAENELLTNGRVIQRFETNEFSGLIEEGLIKVSELLRDNKGQLIKLEIRSNDGEFLFYYSKNTSTNTDLV